MNIIENFTQFSYLSAMILSLLAGLLTSLNPCMWAMSTSLLAFQERSKARSFFTITLTFMISFTLAFTLVGIVAVSFGDIVLKLAGQFEGLFNKLLALIFILLGFYVLRIHIFGFFKILPNKANRINPTRRQLYNSRNERSLSTINKALILGTLFGLSPNPCTAPMVLAIVAYTAASSISIIFSIPLLVLFGLGHSTPFLFIGWITEKLKQAGWIYKWHNIFNKTIGVILLLVGVYFLIE